MIARFVQTKRTMTIELVLALILAFAFAYTRVPDPVPVSTGISVPQLVATPAPVPSWTFSVVPETRHSSRKEKIASQAAQPSFAANPAPVPIAAKISPDVIESIPTAVAKEAVIPAPETTIAIATKPAEAPALETTPEPAAPVPAYLEDLAIAPAPSPDPKEAVAMAAETASSPTPKELPASVLTPAQTQASPSISTETIQTASLVGGTAAAFVFAPISAPVSVILGIAVGLFEPSSSQLGQNKSAPAKNTKTTKRPAAGATTPSSDSVY
jgi:hypothetical protein